ncbi:MAG: diacylglycerol/lipid kinase family protein [Marinifilaceae bacterium]
MAAKKMLFIVNPISGFGWGKDLPNKLRSMSDYKDIDYEIVFTEYGGHARKLVEEARKLNKYTHIVAAGGDGTVNEVGVALMGSDIALGIIGLGSGNGFARHLGYSIFMHRALRQVLTDQCEQVDVLQMNDKFALNVNGVGFDAEVAHAFNKGRWRGPLSYMYNIIRLYFKCPEKRYKITSGGEVMRVKCFVLSFANSSQYGNNAFIAPLASIRDGMMDICILRRPAMLDVLFFLFTLLNKNIYRLSFFKEFQCDEAIVEGRIDKVHVDGDAYHMKSPLHLKMHKGVLKVVVPKDIEPLEEK